MSLSKKHLNTNKHDVSFDIEGISECLKEKLPEVSFALLMGSAQNGIVRAYSDFDLAVYLKPFNPCLSLYGKIEVALESLLPAVRIDTGILNQVEPVYRFEALKGTLLFARDKELYARFFSLTCREYESQMVSYERQIQYRKEARHAIQWSYTKEVVAAK
jgi:predicted nucleotidyltransferase